MVCVKWSRDGEQGCVGGGITDEGGGEYLSASSVTAFFHRVFLINTHKLKGDSHVVRVFLGDFKDALCLWFSVVNVQVSSHFPLPQSKSIDESNRRENPAPVIDFDFHRSHLATAVVNLFQGGLIDHQFHP